MIKKLNAVLGLVTILLMLVHVISMSLLLNGSIQFHKELIYIAMIFILLFIIHIFVSVVIMFFFNDGSSPMQYPSLNVRTIIQRSTAIIMVIFFHMHFEHYTKTAADGTLIFVQPDIGIFLAEAVLIITVVMHAAISLPKAFITLGITDNEKRMKKIVRVSDIVGIVITLFAIVSLFMYCF